MRPEAPAAPLTVWVGSTKFVFLPGRDIVVGYGDGFDIPLDRVAGVSTPPTMRPDLVLRFTGTHWVALDRSPHGIFADGARQSEVDIRDGQVIFLGDPQRGPRLIFNLGTPAASPSGPPDRTDEHVPTQRDTQRIPIPTPRPPTDEPPTRTVELPLPPGPVPPPVAPPAPTMPPMTMPPMTKPPIPVPPAPHPPQPSPPAPPSRDGSSTFRLPLMAGARTTGVAAYRLDLTVDQNPLLTGVSFTARPATLNAVFGPSAARNSALLELLSGARAPTTGVVTVDEHDVRAEPEAMRSRIGIVTGDDLVHPQLTVEQALGYEAELRLPPDTSRDHRRRVVEQVLDELELTPHRAARIARVSPEVRRCVSLAIELVTRPTLLVVDEPGAGLDPAQEAHVMALLRRQADLGCVVVVAIASSSATSVNHLKTCDQVLLLSPDGTPAFVGPPVQIAGAMGTDDWSQVLARVSADPQAAHRAFRARQQTSAGVLPPTVSKPAPPPAELGVKRQIGVVTRRQLRLLLTQPVFLLFVSILPFALAGLTLLIPGDSGLDRAGPSSRNAHEALEILAALNIAAVIMGTALTIRDLVGEWRIFRRDQAIGLSTPAYVAAKIIVFGLAAAIQAAALTAVVVLVRGGPAHGAAVLGNADVELYASVAVTAIVSAIVGLALSSLGKSLREVLPLVVPVILASLLFAGGLVKLVGTWGFDQLSWFVPAHWGFAAAAATVDLHRVDALAADAEMWTHYAGWWVFDMGMLVVFGAAWAGFVLFRLRQPR